MRRLSAIMFTDMVGYTALMQEDEHRATQVRDRHRTVLRDAIEHHGGEIVQFYGDGTLSVFPSAVNSVAAAVQIQQLLQRPPEIPVRIGLHLGDIVHDEDGIHGDGVNVAARVQGLGVPGAILLSDRVSDELKNHPQFALSSLGTFELKNVKTPMPVCAVAAEGVVVPTPDDLEASSRPAAKSIAVLPFVSMSSDPENEFFSDGITEEILNTLTKFEGLNVTARTSSFAFKGRNEDVRKIGEALNVGFVLEGSVRKAGKRVRITAQLIDTSDGYHLFSNAYDRVLDDIFATQDEISMTIAEELRILLPTAPKAERRPARKPTENPQAYTLYLKGLHCWRRWTPDASREALEHFRAALELDPDFALAHTGIASCYSHLGATGKLHREEAYPVATAAALRAIELDPEIGKSHLALGLVKLFYDWDLPGAKACCERAVELSPGSAEIQYMFAYYFMAVGDTQRLLEVSELAESLDPLSPMAITALGQALTLSGRGREALAVFDRALDVEPSFRTAVEGKAWANMEIGETDQAIEEFERYRSMIPDGQGGYAPGVSIYALAGRHEEANEYLVKLEERERNHPELTMHVDFTVAYSALGRMDEAVDRLRMAIEARVGGLVFLRHGIPGSEMRDDPRIDGMLREIGL